MKIYKFGFVLVAAAAASAIVTKIVYSQATHKPSATITIRELFARQPEAGFFKAEYKIVALRSDGSKAEWREIQSPASQIVVQREISDLSVGARILLDGLTNSRTEYRFPEDTVKIARSPRACPGLDKDIILGYEVVRQVEERRDEKHSQIIRSESWRAPSLDCLSLRDKRSVQPSGGAFWTTNLREAIAVAPGEPDPKYFAIPAAYVERKPSEVLEEYARRYGERGAPPETAAKLDAIHASARQ